MNEIISIDEQNVDDYSDFFPFSILEECIADKRVELYGIFSDGAAAGGIAVRRVFPDAELLWVHVADDMAGSGIGSDSLVNLFLELYREGISDVRVTLVPGTDPRLLSVLRGFEFKYTEANSGSLVCTLGELRANKSLNKCSKKCEALSEITAKTLNTLIKSVNDSGANLIGNRLDRRYFNDELSSVYMEGTEAKGLFLVADEPDGSFRISFMYSQSENALAPVEMMRRSFSAGNGLGDDTRIVFDLVGEELIEFIEVFLGKTVERTRKGVLSLAYIDRYMRETEKFFSFYDIAI